GDERARLEQDGADRGRQKGDVAGIAGGRPEGALADEREGPPDAADELGVGPLVEARLDVPQELGRGLDVALPGGAEGVALGAGSGAGRGGRRRRGGLDRRG